MSNLVQGELLKNYYNEALTIHLIKSIPSRIHKKAAIVLTTIF